MKLLPSNLQYLELNLYNNKLVECDMDVKKLSEAINQLPDKVTLYLYCDNIYFKDKKVLG